MIQYHRKKGRSLQKEQALSAKLKWWPRSEAVKTTTIRRFSSSWGNLRSKWQRHSREAPHKTSTLSRIRLRRNSTLGQINNSRLSSSKHSMSIWGVVRTKMVANKKLRLKLRTLALISTRSPKSKSRSTRVLMTARSSRLRKRFLSLPLSKAKSTLWIRPIRC